MGVTDKRQIQNRKQVNTYFKRKQNEIVTCIKLRHVNHFPPSTHVYLNALWNYL